LAETLRCFFVAPSYSKRDFRQLHFRHSLPCAICGQFAEWRTKTVAVRVMFSTAMVANLLPPTCFYHAKDMPKQQ